VEGMLTGSIAAAAKQGCHPGYGFIDDDTPPAFDEMGQSGLGHIDRAEKIYGHDLFDD